MRTCSCSWRTPTFEERHLKVFYVRVEDPKCPDHAPIEPSELWDAAQKAWNASQTDEERSDIQQSKTGELDWSQGFVCGLSESIKRLEDFGMNNSEIRCALGLVKK